MHITYKLLLPLVRSITSYIIGVKCIIVAPHQLDELTTDDLYFNTEFRTGLQVYYNYNSLQLIATVTMIVYTYVKLPLIGGFQALPFIWNSV